MKHFCTDIESDNMWLFWILSFLDFEVVGAYNNNKTGCWTNVQINKHKTKSLNVFVKWGRTNKLWVRWLFLLQCFVLKGSKYNIFILTKMPIYSNLEFNTKSSCIHKLFTIWPSPCSLLLLLFIILPPCIHSNLNFIWN